MISSLRDAQRHNVVGTKLLLLLVALCGPPAGYAAAADTTPELPAGLQPRQWRIVWSEDPATTAWVCWSTREAGETHEVRYARKGSDESPRTASSQRNGRYDTSDDGEQLFYHHARLTKLLPDTAYEVQMISDGEVSPKFHFVTAPAEDRGLSILFGGDSRSDPATRRKMNRQMAQLLSASERTAETSDDIYALAHGGDYIASGRSLPEWSRWLSDHELTTTDEGRLLPIIPARGNHDRGRIFNQAFGFDADDLNYYAVNLGPQIRVVTLNTEISTAGDQAKWLQKELAESRPRHRWVIAQYHRPAYPAVKLPSSALLSWVPLFEKYGVDLVCEADGHNIKRTVPIRNGRKDESGIVYVGEGGLGVPQRTPKRDRWYLQPPGMADRGHHVQVLTFTQSQLRYTCVLLGGEIRDRYVRSPRK